MRGASSGDSALGEATAAGPEAAAVFRTGRDRDAAADSRMERYRPAPGISGLPGRAPVPEEDSALIPGGEAEDQGPDNSGGSAAETRLKVSDRAARK